MRACVFLAFFLLQLLSFKPVSSSVPDPAFLLDSICYQINQFHAYSYCINIIGPDPRSKTIENMRDVAILAADISIDKAVEYQSYAKNVLENATDADTKVKAEGAIRIFTDAIKELKSVKESLIANSHAGVISAADVARKAEKSASNLIDFAKFKHDYDNISYVLWSFLTYMKW